MKRRKKQTSIVLQIHHQHLHHPNLLPIILYRLHLLLIIVVHLLYENENECFFWVVSIIRKNNVL